MKLSIIATALALAFAGAAQAQSTPGSTDGDARAKTRGMIDTPAQRAEEKEINSAYKADRAKCANMKGNQKDICVAEAKGKHNVAKAEQEVKENDTPRARIKVDEAKADAEYGVAKQRCQEQTGNARSTCEKEAKATRDKARTDAKTKHAGEKSNAGSGSTAASKMAR
jgi:hypothetical protein